MEFEAVGDQGHADQDDERQRQHLHRRVPVDEVSDRIGGQHHHQHRGNDGRGHDRHVVDQTDRGDDRVEREDDVDDCDLRDHGAEGHRRAAARTLAFLALHRFVDFHRALDQQEQAAADQHQIAHRDFLAERNEQRRRHARQPGQREQQTETRQAGERQAELARFRTALRRQLADRDRDEHEIVDTEHDLERGQHQQRQQAFRGEQHFHRFRSSAVRADSPRPRSRSAW